MHTLNLGEENIHSENVLLSIEGTCAESIVATEVTHVPTQALARHLYACVVVQHVLQLLSRNTITSDLCAEVYADQLLSCIKIHLLSALQHPRKAVQL